MRRGFIIAGSVAGIVLLLAAVAIVYGFVIRGGGESGELSLPPPTAAQATVPAAQQQPAATPEKPAATGVAGVYMVGEGSETTFTVREELVRIPTPFDAVIRTTTLSGEIDLEGGESNVTIDLHSLSSDEQFRDRYIRQVMFPSSRTASFTVEGIEGVAESLSGGETITRSVEGVLSIRGIEVPLTFEVEARLDGEVLHVLGRTTFTWEQLEIPVPTARSVVSLADEVRVEVLLRATPGAR